ncbi:hypothetical protein FRB95_007001 [Tulasnella sp. JGI-2019a]|nr:hypothetical protein FRB95_007001 [Tulasnella sp. JGI-2019a]
MSGPPELWLLIIEELVKPTHISSYRLASEPLSNLSNLCLVNQQFKDLVEPILYSRAYVTKRNWTSLDRVFTAGTSDAAHSNIMSKGRFVKSLAIQDFSAGITEAQCRAITKVLSAARFSLQRLFLDVHVTGDNIKSLGQSLGGFLDAMQNLASVRELCHLRPCASLFQQCFRGFLAKGTLQRVLLFGLSIYYQFPILEPPDFTNLDLLVLAIPYLPSSLAEAGSNSCSITYTLRIAKRLLLLVPENGASQITIQGVDSVFRSEGVDRSQVEVADIRLSPLVESVINGEIWDIDQVSWATYVASFGT